jgi:acyl-CoA reductase-like NAD-dependent aldehyde dehydrogenase
MVLSKTSTIESINPATKAVLGRVPVLGEDDVRLTVERSWHCFEEWQLTPLKKRAKLMANLRKVIAGKADELAKMISEEVGKPLPEAYFSELSGPLDTCLWLVTSGEKLLADQPTGLTNPLLASKQSIITYEPLGVIGIISPWNYPFSIPMMTTIMALYAGNTVVIKPSEKSPLIGIKIGELFLEAGFPSGCVEIITGDRQTGEYLSKSRLGRLIFTGSVGGGQAVMAQAALSLTPVSLELGGKDAAIVLPDAPVDWTAKGLTWGAFTNAGQACASVERVYIVKGKQTDEMIKAIVAATQKLRVGPSSDPLSDIGPLIDQGQLDKVAGHVEEALAMGAKALTGGKVRDDLGGFFFEPTVLTGVTHDMKIMREETFGPVMPIMVVDTEDHAVELANDSEYGLCATIWAGKLPRAECVARDISVGTVLINDVLFSHAVPQLPWGGLKKSGFGRGHSILGLHDLCNIKHISIDSASGAHRVWWYPYSRSRIKLAQGGIQLLHGGLTKRTSGLVDFVSNLFARAEKKKQSPIPPSTTADSESTAADQES